MDKLTTSEKIRLLAEKCDKPVKQLAEEIGISKQNMNGKINRDNWCENDLKKIAAAAGAEIEITFILNGERI